MLLQDEIARAVRVPVLLSCLTLIPIIRRLTGDRPLGILTASARDLGTQALARAGCSGLQIDVAAMEQHRIFAETLLPPKSAQLATLDPMAMSAAVTDVARKMIAAHPDIAALILAAALSGRTARVLDPRRTTSHRLTGGQAPSPAER